MANDTNTILPQSVILCISSNKISIDCFEIIYLAPEDVGSFAFADFKTKPISIILDYESFSTDTEIIDILLNLEKVIPHNVTLLYYDEVTVDSLMTFVHKGLFNAITSETDNSQLQAEIKRCVTVAEARVAAMLLKMQHSATNEMIHKHRQTLLDRIEKADDSLVSSHNKLEQTLSELNNQMAQLSLLYKFGRELSSASNWDHTLERILQSLAQFVSASGAALVLRPSPESPFSPRKTYKWDQSNLDRMLNRLESERTKLRDSHTQSDGVFHISLDDKEIVTALPLDHKSICLGYLLLLNFGDSDDQNQFLPLLNAIKIILAEEVASAQMLDRIRELSAFNSQVLETVNSGIWVFDQDGGTIYCNRQGRELITGQLKDARNFSIPAFGIGRGRSASNPDGSASFLRDYAFNQGEIAELLNDDLLEINSEIDVKTKVYLASKESYTGEGFVHQPDGKIVPVLIQSSPMQGPKHNWLVVVLDDLRATKKLEAEKIRADNLQSLVEMSSTLAHEIRNPLMGLSAQAELLQESLNPDDDKVRYLNVITNEVSRINSTITRMLNYTRPYEPELSETDIISLVKECIVLAQPRFVEKSVSVVFVEPDDDKFLLIADESQMKQVILNILINAIDASPAEQTVTISFNNNSDLEQIDLSSGFSEVVRGIAISIQDNGSGFNSEDIEKLFRPFYTTKTSGTGLGLSMCKKIIDAHHGKIVATNNGCTTFKICIPVGVQNNSSVTLEEN